MMDEDSDGGIGAASSSEDAIISANNNRRKHTRVLPAPRTSKRRRLNDTLDETSSQPSSSDEASEGDDSDQSTGDDGSSQTREDASTGEPSAENKWPRRPKRMVHIPKQAEQPKTTYQLGTQAPASSPYRIRGPRWKIPKVGPQAEPSTNVYSSPDIRRTKPVEDRASPSSCSEDDAFDPLPHPVRNGLKSPSALACQGRNSLSANTTPTKTPQPLPSRVRQEGSGPGRSQTTPSRPLQSSPPLFISGVSPLQQGLAADIAGELEDLPSDAFDSSDSFDTPAHAPRPPQRQLGGSTAALPPQQRLVGPQTGLRQTTLFGSAVRESPPASQVDKRRNFPRAAVEEKPTHHLLNAEECQTWTYPTNLGTIRDYQFNIVARGLFHNMLVALPTGLGKTFIAATIILNWMRWTKDAQIVFVAPTKPLVAQQIEACYGIVGIPPSQTTMLTGSVAPGIRDEEWRDKRVFFMTPQTLMNDLSHGRADPKRIVCIVVDEAHRATGSYAYVEVIKFISRFNTSYRVLALTATPGASVEAVQEVIDGLNISRVEIRTEDSLDIRQYVHKRNVEMVTFDPSDDIIKMKGLFSKTLQPVLDELNRANACWIKDPMSLTAYGLTKSRVQWMQTAGRNANMGIKGKMNAIFSILASLAHSITLLNFHGIAPFYHNLLTFRADLEGGKKNGKYAKQINESPHFNELMAQGQRWINDVDFIGHPKLEYLREVVMNHFLDAGEGREAATGAPPSATRIMVFCQYRDSAEEVARVLRRNQPMIRPRVFVGQAGAKGSEGMNQKTQADVIDKFQKGTYNTLIATSVGEEGLDIGEVDLIICYDSSASPIRMLQRMGRTGRKRAGKIVLLLMKGKEEDSFTKAKDGYEKMQQMIAAGTRFTFHDDRSPRIMPKEVQPVVDKRKIDIPIENTQAPLPEPGRRGRGPKKAAKKKFHMPDGVITGFVRASRLDGGDRAEVSSDDEHTVFLRKQLTEEELVPVPALDVVALSTAEDRELERRFQNIAGDDEINTVSVARLDAFPDRQRELRRTKLVSHGQLCRRTVSMLNAMHDMDVEQFQRLAANVHADDRAATEQRHPTKRSERAKAVDVRFSSVPIEVEDEYFEAEEGHARPRRGSMPAAAQVVSSTPGEGDDDNIDDDMDGFIVDDDDDEHNAPEEPTTSLTSSPSSLGDHDTRFYISPKVAKRQRTESDSSLPDFGTLVKQWTADEEEPVQATTASRRVRRHVLSDSDDE